MGQAIKNALLVQGAALAAGVFCLTVQAGYARAADSDHMHMHEHGDARAGGYAPGLGEIMALQQMRHAKLWLAGSADNWPLAGYELDELKEGFEDAARYHAVHDNVPVGAMIEKLTAEPMAALAKAIEARNAAQFAQAFDRLSAACNACHQAAGHPYIRIGRPAGSPYPNQIFAPAAK